MKTMKRAVLVGALLAPVGLYLGFAPAPAPAPAEAKRFEVDPVQRGRYLVQLGGCNDCHTPLRMTPEGPRPDVDRLLSGHPATQELPPPPNLKDSPWFAATAGMTAWTGPWGISYAANLTSDPNTGLGFWTEEMFVKAMRTGKHMGAGRDILPPMPWQSLSGLTDDDLLAMFAYLRTVPPVANPVPDPIRPDGMRFE